MVTGDAQRHLGHTVCDPRLLDSNCRHRSPETLNSQELMTINVDKQKMNMDNIEYSIVQKSCAPLKRFI